MYLRTTARANKDGSVVRYLALAHNQRHGSATKANVLLNLGREDRLDPDPPWVLWRLLTLETRMEPAQPS